MKEVLIALWMGILSLFGVSAPDEANMLGGGPGTINQLDQWKSTSTPSAITQNVYGKPILITGLDDGCVELLNGLATTTTGLPCGSGSGGGGLSTTSPFTAGDLVQVVDDGTVRSIATSSLGITSSQWTTNGSNIYYNTGNVGIGTSTPASKLTIYQSAYTSAGGITFDSVNGGAINNALYRVAASQMALRAGGNDVFFDAGDIRTSSGPRIRGAAGASTTPTYAWNGDPNTGMYNPSADALGFSTAGLERLRIDSSGNFGIGTTTPSQRLTVAGTSSATAYTIPGITNGCATWVSSFLTTTGSPCGGGSSVSFGSTGQVPYTNGTTDDFNYAAGLSFSGTDLTLGDQVYGGNGSQSDPTYSFTNDTDTGWFWGGSNKITAALGGIEAWTFQRSGSVNYFYANTSGGPQLVGAAGSATTPNVQPNSNDFDTGLWGDGSNGIFLAAGGSNILEASLASGVYVPANFRVTGTSTQATTTISKLTVPSLVSCDTIDTDASGNFSCGTDASGGGGGGGTNYWSLISGGLQTSTSTDFARAAYFVATSTTATSTFPILSVSTIFSLFGNIYTTLAQMGTALVEAITSVTPTGVWNFNGATVKQHTYKSFTWPGTATTTSATTTVPMGTAYTAEAWNGVDCWVTSGSGPFIFTDGTNRMNGATATTTVARTTLSTNNTFTAGERRYIEIGPLTDAMISCTVDVTVNN